MNGYRTIRFQDQDGVTSDALAYALHEQIERNLDVFIACLRDAGETENELDDAVGLAKDSLRLARVLLSL